MEHISVTAELGISSVRNSCFECGECTTARGWESGTPEHAGVGGGKLSRVGNSRFEQGCMSAPPGHKMLAGASVLLSLNHLCRSCAFGYVLETLRIPAIAFLPGCPNANPLLDLLLATLISR